MKDAKARAMLIAALAILVIALVWLIILEAKSPVRALCTRLKDYGYNIAPGDLYLQGYGSDTSIRGLLSGDGISDEEIETLVSVSRQKGFDADIYMLQKREPPTAAMSKQDEELFRNICANRKFMLMWQSFTDDIHANCKSFIKREGRR